MDKGIFMSSTVAVIVIGIMSALSGCNLDSFITLSPPDGVRKSILLPDERYSYADQAEIWSEWEDYVKNNTQALASETERAAEARELIGSMIDTGIGFLETSSGLFPGGALLAGLAGMGAGIFVPKPGTKRKIQDVRNESADKLAGILRTIAVTHGDDPEGSGGGA